MEKEKLNIGVARHSLSHVLAAAVLEMFPEAKLGIGPDIENGFYYDFDLPRTLIPEDLPLLEKKMRKIIADNYLFEKSEQAKDKALEFFEKTGQNYKIELIKDLEDGTISFYELIKKDGEKRSAIFVDLCKGPHLESTRDLQKIAFKLDKIAGAYWRGSEKNKMLQRIYGLAFESKEELNKYEEFLKEAEKRDHKRLGRELDLFSFHPEAPGMPFWHEKGMIVWNEMEKFGKKLRKEYGYIEIKTPILAKNDLWVTSGHWDHYHDGMFTFDVDGASYGLKPMDCPFNIKIYQTRQRSYRELPIRYTEIGINHRKEKSGELNGLLRVQQITQDDSHLFLREDQIKQEITSLIKMVKEYYKKIGLKPEFFLSTRPDDFMGEIPVWDKAEADLKDVLDSNEIEYKVKDKDGAFYGPKIDVDVKDALNRSWQVATIQLDFQLPGRFNCEYIDEDGKAKTPVMIHAAIFGSFERMIGILIENFGGALPTWLAPVQAIIIPISEKHLEYAKKVEAELLNSNIRVELDSRNESMGKKIRESEMQKIPYMLVIGDKEIESNKVTVRKYKVKEQEALEVNEVIESIQK